MYSFSSIGFLMLIIMAVTYCWQATCIQSSVVQHRENKLKYVQLKTEILKMSLKINVYFFYVFCRRISRYMSNSFADVIEIGAQAINAHLF